VVLLFAPLITNLRAYCLYLVLLLAPLSLRMTFLAYPKMGGAGAVFIEIADPFLVMLLAFQFRDWIKGYREFRFPRPALFWSLMIGLGVLSVVLGPLRTVSLNETVRMAKLLLLLLAITNEVRRPAQFRNAVVAIAVGVVLQSAIALLQFGLGHQLGLHVLGESTEDDITALAKATFTSGDLIARPDGLMGHPNLLAGYLALYMPVAVALILAPTSRKLKALLALALLVGQPALVFTLSRTGWIDFGAALAIVLALGAVHPVSRRKFLGARIAIVMVTSVIILVLSPHIIYRIFDSDPNAVNMRLEWLQTARAIIIDHPVLGVGLNTYVFAQVPYGKDKTPEAMTDRYGDIWPAVHNSYLLCWTEQGTVGFLCWVMVHFFVLRVAWQNLRIKDPVLHALGVGLTAGFIAIMIDGLTSFFVRCEAPARMFWIAVGLILALGYWRRANEEAEGALAESLRPARPPRSRVPASGGWLPAGKSAWR
jgi:hypothetical protein